MITLTIDLEDPSGRYASDGRYITMTRKIMDMCDELKCRATFFAIGRVMDGSPQLLRDIAAKGHELAYHSHDHLSLTEEEPARFRQQTKIDKDRFEQLTGKPVKGFRAPRFSLTPQSLWAVDVLKELGFTYSSSIMPTNISRFGFPEAKHGPFKWPNGLVELPLPVADIGSFKVPYLGGIYLYALPAFLTRRWAKTASTNEVLWTYTHPYDFDTGEKFKPMPGEPLWVSAVLYAARRVAEKKIRKVLAIGCGPILAEHAAKL